MKKLLFLFFLVLLFLQAQSQTVTPQSELDYIIEEFTLPGGRSGNNVNCIVEGPHGFMWFGSHGGLHRYDGNEFVTYRGILGDTIGETTSLTYLITNAFHAVMEKRFTARDLARVAYEPTVMVSTKKVGDKIEIRVRDNGNGIPQKVLDKIFQPFFTTKASGQGTGLGLSLSYDIMKAHGGELTVETKEGEGSEFIVKLPIT